MLLIVRWQGSGTGRSALSPSGLRQSVQPSCHLILSDPARVGSYGPTWCPERSPTCAHELWHDFVMAVSVRVATPEDAAAVGEVHAESWRVGFADRFTADELARAIQRRRRMWSGVMAHDGFPLSSLLVAEDTEAIIGFLHLGPARERTGDGEIYALYLVPRVWGGRAAHLLMDEALLRLSAQGFDRAILWTHGEGRAATFYNKTGWQLTGRQRYEDLGDDLRALVVEYEHPLIDA